MRSYMIRVASLKLGSAMGVGDRREKFSAENFRNDMIQRGSRIRGIVLAKPAACAGTETGLFRQGVLS